MKRSAIIAAVALLSAAGAVAKPAPADPGADAKAEKKVCQTEHVTGSLARTQEICMTAAEWDALRHQSKRDVEDIQRNNGAIAGQSGAASSSGIVR